MKIRLFLMFALLVCTFGLVNSAFAQRPVTELFSYSVAYAAVEDKVGTYRTSYFQVRLDFDKKFTEEQIASIRKILNHYREFHLFSCGITPCSYSKIQSLSKSEIITDKTITYFSTVVDDEVVAKKVQFRIAPGSTLQKNITQSTSIKADGRSPMIDNMLIKVISAPAAPPVKTQPSSVIPMNVSIPGGIRSSAMPSRPVN